MHCTEPENSRDVNILVIENYCFMSREYIILHWMCWSKGSVVTRSTKVCYPLGTAALKLTPKWLLFQHCL
jgi:hypothetical protein